LGSGEGHEQEGARPALVISVDQVNQGPSGLAIVVPLIRTRTGVHSRIEINPPEGGVRAKSFIMCEQVRAISQDRILKGPIGVVYDSTLEVVEDWLRILLGL